MSVQWLSADAWNNWKEMDADSFIKEEDDVSEDTANSMPNLADSIDSQEDDSREPSRNASPSPTEDLVSNGRISAKHDERTCKLVNDESVSSSGVDTRRSSSRKPIKNPLLGCTLTGNYWQLPENENPCNRPKRANAGALMVTKLGLKRRKSEPAVKKEPSPTKPRVAKKSISKRALVWPGKAVSKSTQETITEDDMVISRVFASRCIFSVPESICFTPHVDFVQQHHEWFEESEITELKLSITKLKPQIDVAVKKSGMDNYLKKLARRKKNLVEQPIVVPSSESLDYAIESHVMEEGKIPKPNGIKAPPAIKESISKPKPSSSRRKYEEDEKTEIIKLENNRIMADGQLFEVNHENYVRETDVDIPYDDHEFLSVVDEDFKHDTENRPPETLDIEPSLSKQPCSFPHCRLGCICPPTGAERPEGKVHCGKLNCMLECNCNVAGGWNSEDANIRSRLRPRVSLLNWNYRLNYMDAFINEKEKDSGSKQSRSESQAHGRIKRHIVPPKRNNDFVSHSPSKKQAKLAAPTKNQAKLSYKKLRSRLTHKRQPFVRTLKSNNAKETIDIGSKKIIRTSNLGYSKSESKQSVAHLSGRNPKVTKKLNSTRNCLNKSRPPILSPRQAVNGGRMKPLIAGVDFSLEGTGPPVPPDIMAKFAPFLEIQYQPRPDRFLPLLSESEESSDDDENDQETIFLNYLKSKQQPASEDSFPVIVSYRSCQLEIPIVDNIDAAA